MESLILVINPGSASRKYSLYSSGTCLIDAHYEKSGESVVLILSDETSKQRLNPGLHDLEEAIDHFCLLLVDKSYVQHVADISGVGIRIVAPGSYFLEDHVVDDDFLSRLRDIYEKAPLHINTVLSELEHIGTKLSHCPIFAVSDSAFHRTKSDVSWNYGIPLDLADSHDIKRFGYHGLSVASAVRTFRTRGLLPGKLVICHLGSGSSVTAVVDGLSLNTTMGYSPLEGVPMSTRSGTIDPVALFELQSILQLNRSEVEAYLNTECGLYGLSGQSGDIRELLDLEQSGNYRAGLALRSYIQHVRREIVAMASDMGGLDALVFTGTVGERSHVIRKRILENLSFINLAIDDQKNTVVSAADKPTVISIAGSRIVYVLSANEDSEIALRSGEHLEEYGDSHV